MHQLPGPSGDLRAPQADRAPGESHCAPLGPLPARPWCPGAGAVTEAPVPGLQSNPIHGGPARQPGIQEAPNKCRRSWGGGSKESKGSPHASSTGSKSQVQTRLCCGQHALPASTTGLGGLMMVAVGSSTPQALPLPSCPLTQLLTGPRCPLRPMQGGWDVGHGPAQWHPGLAAVRVSGQGSGQTRHLRLLSGFCPQQWYRPAEKVGSTTSHLHGANPQCPPLHLRGGWEVRDAVWPVLNWPKANHVSPPSPGPPEPRSPS